MAFSIDKATLDKASRGEGAALARLVSAVEPHIEKQLLRYPLSEEDRRDLAQSTLMQIIRRVGSFRGDASFSTWLFRVTVNVCRDMGRRKRPMAVLEDLPSEQADAFHNAARNQQREMLRRGLAFLGPRERAALVLRDVEGLSTREVACVLGTSETTVRAQISTARLKLRAFTSRWSGRHS